MPAFGVDYAHLGARIRPYQLIGKQKFILFSVL